MDEPVGPVKPWVLLLDGQGGATPGDPRHPPTDDRVVWLHLPVSPESEALLRDVWRIPDEALGTLSRPSRSVWLEILERGELVIVMRLPGDVLGPIPDARIYVSPLRVVTLVNEGMTAMATAAQRLEHGRGARDAQDLVRHLLSAALAMRLGTAADLDERILTLEFHLDRGEPVDGALLRKLHLDVLAARRFAFALESAVSQVNLALPRILAHQRRDLRYLGRSSEALIREYESMEQRIRVIRDEIGAQLANRSQQTLYLLTIISTFFLPLGFLTGLLGVNLGGIPGRGTTWAFATFCAALVVLGVAQWRFIRSRKLV